MAKKTAKERADARRAVLELRFASLYVANGRNATQAYMAIFPRAQQGSAASKGSLWLRKENIRTEIGRLTDLAWKDEQLSADEVLGRMGRIARQNIADYYWRPGELDRQGQETVVGQRKPLSQLTEAQTECIKGFKFSATGLVIQEHHDKLSQLANVGKHLKLLTDKTEVDVTGGKFIVQWGGDESKE